MRPVNYINDTNNMIDNLIDIIETDIRTSSQYIEPLKRIKQQLPLMNERDRKDSYVGVLGLLEVYTK